MCQRLSDEKISRLIGTYSAAVPIHLLMAAAYFKNSIEARRDSRSKPVLESFGIVYVISGGTGSGLIAISDERSRLLVSERSTRKSPGSCLQAHCVLQFTLLAALFLWIHQKSLVIKIAKRVIGLYNGAVEVAKQVAGFYNGGFAQQSRDVEIGYVDTMELRVKKSKEA
jgi:hypothetical protein